MICAVCKSPMIVVEYRKIELDHCPRCHSVWFDSGELELFLGSLNLEKPDQFMSSLSNATETKTAEKKRKCPLCSRPMKKVNTGEKPGIPIDVCPRGEGVWFDGGEVAELIKQLPAEPSAKPLPPQEISAFLAEVFRADRAAGTDTK